MRINIEDKLFGDYRFKALVRLLGNEWTAIGMCVEFWRAAGKHWGDDGSLVPLDQFQIQGFGPLLEVGLARKQDGGIYACGLLDQLDWYRQKRESASAAGKASAASRKLKFGTAQPSKKQNEVLERPFDETRTRVERPFDETRTDSNAPAPAPAPALLKKEEIVVSAPEVAPPSAEIPLAKIWAEECPGLPQPRKITASRLRSSKQRFRENPSEDYWREVARRIASSQFCQGVNDKHWTADFDFFIRPDTHVKALEGKYDDSPSQRPKSYVPTMRLL